MVSSKPNEKKVSLKTDDEELKNLINLHRTVIKVVGTGGAGNNTISRLEEAGVKGVETIAMNTDAQDLLYTKSDNKLIIGKNITRGLGAGSDPQVGEESARENEKEIKEFLEGSDVVFITCGLGGGTGTGSAPVIGEIAKNLGALTIAVVTTPFSDEGVLKEKNAVSGLERLRKNSDTVIVIQNDRLLELVPDLPLNAAFKVADEILVNAVKGITELVTKKGLVNLDFSDIKITMKDGDTAMIGIGESESENKAQEAVERAINNPLLDVDITGAQSALINIEGDDSLTIKEARNVMVSIAEKLDPNAKIVWGASINEDLKNKIRILIIATGLRSENRTFKKTFNGMQSDAGPTLQADQEKKLDIISGFRLNDNGSQKAKAGAVAGESKLPKNVFNQIFEDEIQGDVNILKEAVKTLVDGGFDTKVCRNIKNAAAGMKNAAQVYSNKNVVDFATFIGDLFDLMSTNKIKFNPEFLPMLSKVPQIFEGMIAGYTIAVDDAEQVMKQLSVLMDDKKPLTPVEPAKKKKKKPEIKQADKT
ncbi:cell division protein FtsZ, partial [candidate division KSB1 bacterium 4572_119]